MYLFTWHTQHYLSFKTNNGSTFYYLRPDIDCMFHFILLWCTLINALKLIKAAMIDDIGVAHLQ